MKPQRLRRRGRNERLKRIAVWTVLAIFLLSIVGLAFVVTVKPQGP